MGGRDCLAPLFARWPSVSVDLTGYVQLFTRHGQSVHSQKQHVFKHFLYYFIHFTKKQLSKDKSRNFISIFLVSLFNV